MSVGQAEAAKLKKITSHAKLSHENNVDTN
jgi:hypothetical protein